MLHGFVEADRTNGYIYPDSLELCRKKSFDNASYSSATAARGGLNLPDVPHDPPSLEDIISARRFTKRVQSGAGGVFTTALVLY